MRRETLLEIKDADRVFWGNCSPSPLTSGAIKKQSLEMLLRAKFEAKPESDQQKVTNRLKIPHLGDFQIGVPQR